uniref:Uncharacterized protein n=1 Tax=Hanusia phi TaxID=3032 RepID=A0A7S0EIK4_9CRYP|mmetsp:Transcript_25346/g.57113  ORF Transcript_25346/g.57113 Transcript_25346/m.57113 type:complete len:283 (+) Transcript_25346:217-1065(+)
MPASRSTGSSEHKAGIGARIVIEKKTRHSGRISLSKKSTCHVSDDDQQDCITAHSLESSNSSEPSQRAPEQLPDGCCFGIPVYKGQPVMQVSIDQRCMEVAMMRSVQNNNFNFVTHMILSGWKPNLENPSLCHFSVTVHRSSWNHRDHLRIKNACLLHYAVCCGSLQAAAVLLIAFPKLATLSCIVSGETESESDEVWSLLRLTDFFRNLYKDQKNDLHNNYNAAYMVLQSLQSNQNAFPFLNLQTMKERFQAAGSDPVAMANMLLEVATSHQNNPSATHSS